MSDAAVGVDPVDGNGVGGTGAECGGHPGGQREQSQRIGYRFRWEDACHLGESASGHHRRTGSRGNTGALTGAGGGGRHCEDVAGGVSGREPTNFHFQASGRPSDPRLGEDPGALSPDMGHGEFQRNHHLATDIERSGATRAGPDHVLGKSEIRQGKNHPEVRGATQARQICGQRDGLGMRVGIDGIDAQTGEVGLPYCRHAAGFELTHGLEFTVEEQRNVIHHREDSVFDHGGTFVRLAAVDVHDVDAVNSVEESVGSHRGEEIGQAGGVAHADQGRYAGGLGGWRHPQHGLSWGQVVADIDVGHPCADRGPKQRRTKIVERPDAVEHAVCAGDHINDIGGVARIHAYCPDVSARSLGICC